MAQPKSRLPLYATLFAAGGVGYYLYSAGGSPKVAEKQFEADLTRASANIKSEIPGRGKQAQKEAEKWGSEAGAKLDATTERARAELAKAEGKLDQYGKQTMKKIDEVDRKVEVEAAKAKSGISSWFGGK
ncbi:calcofluor white hypersensitive protein [Rutstroemia sp. NJR-2017a BBW]|nr:calcofluor white hypersensitive protein [Rutstroemia sp. NJR-2017a BBW]